ncbi:hypothetical protein ACFL0V_02785 [Nanoarchaeota archaeon]
MVAIQQTNDLELQIDRYEGTTGNIRLYLPPAYIFRVKTVLRTIGHCAPIASAIIETHTQAIRYREGNSNALNGTTYLGDFSLNEGPMHIAIDLAHEAHHLRQRARGIPYSPFEEDLCHNAEFDLLEELGPKFMDHMRLGFIPTRDAWLGFRYMTQEMERLE